MEEKNKEFTLAQEHAAPPPECAALPPEVLPPDTILPGEASAAESAAALKKKTAKWKKIAIMLVGLSAMTAVAVTGGGTAEDPVPATPDAPPAQQEPYVPPEPEPEPLAPEPDSDEAFRAEKRRAKHLNRSLTILSFSVAALIALAVLDGLGYMPAAWQESAMLRGHLPVGVMMLAAIFAMDVWKYAFQELKKGHVTSAFGALLLVFAVAFDGIVSAAITQDGHMPFAATTALLMWMEQLEFWHKIKIHWFIGIFIKMR